MRDRASGSLTGRRARSRFSHGPPSRAHHIPSCLSPSLAPSPPPCSALRAGHAGQALDIAGLGYCMDDVIARGDTALAEARILAIHRLKTAVPAASLARMGALVGGGSEAQIEAIGRYYESVGLAFQIMDDGECRQLCGGRRLLQQAVAPAGRHTLLHIPTASPHPILDPRPSLDTSPSLQS